MSGDAWIGRNAGGTSRLRKGPYEDIVDERRIRGDLGWVLRTRRDVPWPAFSSDGGKEVGGPPGKSPADVKREVLASDRLRYGLREICQETGRPMTELMKEAEAILDEMAHSLNMFAVRSFGFAVAKVMKRIYRAVYVNSEGIAQLRKACSEYPVILMPMHRSYADFLLLSLICFDYDLPLPAIASAMDFMGMKFIGSVLRNCGAFFIRRSFATDKVYWLTFVEYVKTHVRDGLHPVEFFIEGTRSRTGKSLHPKTGMLGAILESWFMGEVPDVYLVPVSISYDRVLEEALYAYELLGVPKPRESTSGLLKARALLAQDFGCAHFHFDQPISLRQFAASYGGIDRGLHSLAPKVKAELTPAESRMLQAAARHVVTRHCANAVVSPFCLMAALLLAQPGSQLSASVDSLADSLSWLRRYLVDGCRVSVDWPTSTGDLEASAAAVIADQCRLHGDLVRLDAAGTSVSVVEVPPGGDSSMLARVANGLRLGSYRNQLMCHLAAPALSHALSRGLPGPGSGAAAAYDTLRRLLYREFPVLPERPPSPPPYGGSENDGRLGGFLLATLMPFLAGYWLACDTLLVTHRDGGGGGQGLVGDREIALAVQARGFERLAASAGDGASSWECVSLDLLTNAVHGLHRLGVLGKGGVRGSGCDWLALRRLADLLELLINQLPDTAVRPSTPRSKL